MQNDATLKADNFKGHFMLIDTHCHIQFRPLNNNIEAEILTGRGETRTVTIAVLTMLVNGKEIVQEIIRDITESKRAIEEIKNLAKFPSEDPNPVIRISKDCKILYANDASSPVLKTWQIQESKEELRRSTKGLVITR